MLFFLGSVLQLVVAIQLFRIFSHTKCSKVRNERQNKSFVFILEKIL